MQKKALIIIIKIRKEVSTDRDFERWMGAKQRNKTALSEEKGVSSTTDAESEGAWETVRRACLGKRAE